MATSVNFSVSAEALEKANSVSEVPVTSAVLAAGARHLGESCKAPNDAFVKCKLDNGGNPVMCLDEGVAVTKCTIEFFRAMRNSCSEQFTAQWKCLDVNNQAFSKCRQTQDELDQCVLEKLNLGGAFKTYDTSKSNSSFTDY